MKYTPHTLSCGCCANGCCCRLHSHTGAARACSFHARQPHPGLTSGNYARLDDATAEAQRGGVPFTFVAEGRQ